MFSEGHQFNLYSVLCYFYTEIPTILLLVFFIYNHLNQNNKTSIPVVEIQMCYAAKSVRTVWLRAEHTLFLKDPSLEAGRS